MANLNWIQLSKFNLVQNKKEWKQLLIVPLLARCETNRPHFHFFVPVTALLPINEFSKEDFFTHNSIESIDRLGHCVRSTREDKGY